MGQVSLDDFLSSQQERREKGIKTRWDINSTNEDFAPLLGELKRAKDASATVELPMFSKARDERLVDCTRATPHATLRRCAAVLIAKQEVHCGLLPCNT